MGLQRVRRAHFAAGFGGGLSLDFCPATPPSDSQVGGVWRRGQFLDEHVLHLHQRVPAAVDLDADDAVAGDVRVGLDEVDALHAIDPRLDAWAVGFDDVIIPVPQVERGANGRNVRLHHEPVAAAFVVDRAVPIGFAVVGTGSRRLRGRWGFAGCGSARRC